VLLACALAEVDDLRFFTTAAVKRPLSEITNREFEAFSYARHLKDLSGPGRGRILQRAGESFRLRYRISNPILRPYIVMRGIKDKLITKDQILAGKSATGERLGGTPLAEREYQPGLQSMARLDGNAADIASVVKQSWERWGLDEFWIATSP
jgi:hypothetical protein